MFSDAYGHYYILPQSHKKFKKTIMKIILPKTIDFRGSCKGVTATQISRTETKALYRRSDGYFECFRVIESDHSIFQDGKWTQTGDTIERYPNDEQCSVSAWSGREKTIRGIYEGMKAISDGDVIENLATFQQNNTIAPPS